MILNGSRFKKENHSKFQFNQLYLHTVEKGIRLPLDSVYEKNITRNNYVEKWKDKLFIEDITRRSDIRILSGYFIK